MTALTPPLHHLLWQLKVLCRWSLGFVWIWEGLVPKMLWTSSMQTDLVTRSGLYWPDVETYLVLLGAAMIIAGIVICTGWKERFTTMTATICMGILIVLVVGHRPESLSDMHGGIAKDACLIACAWVVWKLAPLVPHPEAA